MIKKYIAEFLIFPALILLFASCSKSDNNPVNGGNTTASSNIIISIQSSVATPSVKVIGPGSTYNISSTDTLKDVDPGTYTIAVYRIDMNPTGGDLVGTSYGDLDPVRKISLSTGETKTVNINYVQLPASGKLWVSSDNGETLIAFDKSDLTVPGAPPAAITIQFSFEGPRGFAFDKMGNLWVAGFSQSHIFAFSPGQLSGNTTASPRVTLSNNSINGPDGLMFDASGNLWISNWNLGTLVSYKSATLLNMLATTGNVSNTPDVTITSGNLSEPEYMTFDASGNLWVAGTDPSSYDSEILKFLSGNLNSSGDITPSIVITESNQPTLINVSDLAFDKNGNLWGTDGNSFFRFTANQLLVSGSTVPQFYRGVPAPALLSGLAFDSQANLWIGETYAPRLLRYTYPDNGSGSTYNTSSALDEPSWLAFFPAPAGYPIN
jgi:streptogramin lyase